MKLDVKIVAGVVLALAGAALLVVWLNRGGPLERGMVEGLAGPLPAGPAAPPVRPVAQPAAPSAARAPAPLAIYFDFDRATLRAEEAAKLQRLLEQRFARIEAVGHADRIGAAGYNLALSARRAEAVKAYLVERKVAPAAVRAEGRGEREARSGDGCVDLGPETRRNAELVECLQPDRRVEVSALPM